MAPVDASWLDKCPVCKSGKLSPVAKKKFFGLVTAETFECSNCGATFTPKGGKNQLAKVPDTSNPVWREYGNQILTEREWENIAHGGMSDAKQREADIEGWLVQLREGDISPMMDFGGGSPILLKRKEELILALPNITLIEPRAVRRGGGGSVRVAKGLYLRTFEAESHDELRELDRGTLSLTNKRLVFSGAKRVADISLGKVISVEPYKDSIAVRRSGRQRAQYFTGLDQARVRIAIEDRVYEEPLSGLILKYMIEGLVKQKP